jgi:hypothetical protein
MGGSETRCDIRASNLSHLLKRQSRTKYLNSKIHLIRSEILSTCKWFWVPTHIFSMHGFFTYTSQLPILQGFHSISNGSSHAVRTRVGVAILTYNFLLQTHYYIIAGVKSPSSKNGNDFSDFSDPYLYFVCLSHLLRYQRPSCCARSRFQTENPATAT